MESIRYSLVSLEERRPAEVSVRGWLAMATGLNLAFAVCMLVCKPPWPHGLSWPGRFQTAAVYIVLSCLAGAFGNWLAMPRRTSGELGILLRGALRGWVFLPSIALLLQRQSFLAQVVASGAAVLMAMYLFPFTREGALPVEVKEYSKIELFSTEVCIGASSWLPFCISVLLGAAILAGVAGRVIIATLLLSTAIYVLALQLVNLLKRMQEPDAVHRREDQTYILLTAAFLCVLLGLSNPAVLQSSLFAGVGKLAISKAPTIRPQDSASSGYHTIVLWPLVKEKKTLLRFPVKSKMLKPGAAEPLVIPFYGPYWYFKVEGETPGKDAQSTKGDPLKVIVHSTDRLPLLMEAHQRLTEPIETARCGEVQVVVANDAEQGAFAVGLTLADSSSKKATLSLGIQRARSHEGGQREETFTFSVPKRKVIDKFDSLTLTFVPNEQHSTVGRKVAVERFVIVPK